MAREIQDRQGVGKALCNLGVTQLRIEQYVPALKNLQLALEIFREIKDCLEEERTLINLGIVCCASGEYEKAIVYNQQHLELVQATLQQMRRSHYN